MAEPILTAAEMISFLEGELKNRDAQHARDEQAYQASQCMGEKHRRNWVEACQEREQLRARIAQLEAEQRRCWSLLGSFGVSKDRGKTLDNALMVLDDRRNKEVDSLSAENAGLRDEKAILNYSIVLMVAAGLITQAKVEESRSIALKFYGRDPMSEAARGAK
jgi:hypothetical protein